MKKKTIPILLCLLLSLCLGLAGCGGDSFSDVKVSGTQDTSYTVYSNGGGAVQYGNYVYFINGYDGYEDTDAKQNVWPNVVKGALYRAELSGVKNGGEFEIAKNTSAVSDGLEFIAGKGEDYYGNSIDVVSVQLIAPKRIGTSGYDKGGIFIYDNYVYFASPNNEKDKTGTVQANRTDFFRVRLNGTKAEKIYTTENEATSSPYAFYKYNGAVYLVAQDGTDLVSVRIANKVGKKTVICSGVSNVLLPYSETYYKGMNENTLDHFVYVERAVTENDTQKTGNVIEIMRPDGKSGGVYLSQGKTDDTLEAVRDGLLFYRTTDNAGYTLIKYDNLHDFLMGDEEGTYGDAAYKAYQEKLASYVDNGGIFAAGVTDEQKAEYNRYVNSELTGTLLSTKTVSDYTSTYCFRPDYENNKNIVYMLGIKSASVELKSVVAMNDGTEKPNTTITVYNGAASLLNVAGSYMYFTDTSNNTVYRTRWDVAAANKSDSEIMEQVSQSEVTDAPFNGDYCAGYVTYCGKVDDWADAYMLFMQVERAEGTDEVFVGVRTNADMITAPKITLKSGVISWSAIENAQSYTVYRSVNGTEEAVTTGLTETSYTLTDTDAAGEYWVVAVSGTMVSPKSNVVNYKG